jgi:hypothetical protein
VKAPALRLLPPLLGVAGYLVAGLFWLAREPGREEAGSSFDTSDHGTSLAFAYLQDRYRGREVGRLTHSLTRSEVASDAVVFRVIGGGVASRPVPARGGKAKAARPPSPPPPRTLLDPRVEEWVREGGRLVLALDGEEGGVSSRSEGSGSPPRKVHPLWPGVALLRPSPRRSLAGPALEEAVTIFAAGERPVLARLVLGRGEVFLLACPEVLENALLASADHLLLLEALAGARPVYFDERAHGVSEDRGVLPLLLDWNLGPALLIALAGGLAVLWRGRTRVGPAEDPHQERRSEAVDLVDSVAQLYNRALRRDESLRLYYDSLSRAVALRTGLKGAALGRRVRELCHGLAPPRRGPGRDIGEGEFRDVLSVINAAFGGLSHGHPR